MDRLFSMLVNRLLRRVMMRGVRTGIERAARGGKTQAEMTPAERDQTRRSRATARTAQRAMRATRRITRL